MSLSGRSAVNQNSGDNMTVDGRQKYRRAGYQPGSVCEAAVQPEQQRTPTSAAGKRTADGQASVSGAGTRAVRSIAVDVLPSAMNTG